MHFDHLKFDLQTPCWKIIIMAIVYCCNSQHFITCVSPKQHCLPVHTPIWKLYPLVNPYITNCTSSSWGSSKSQIVHITNFCVPLWSSCIPLGVCLPQAENYSFKITFHIFYFLHISLHLLITFSGGKSNLDSHFKQSWRYCLSIPDGHNWEHWRVQKILEFH